MTTKENVNPDYLFEVSWEVCNKIGGIYTVIATKALYLKSQLNKHHILIGPDVWMDTGQNPDFVEDPHLYGAWKEQKCHIPDALSQCEREGMCLRSFCTKGKFQDFSLFPGRFLFRRFLCFRIPNLYRRHPEMNGTGRILCSAKPVP